MLVQVDVTNAQGDILSLPLGDTSSGFVVEDIEGLDPVKATLVSSSFAQLDGAQYHSSRREPRNIKMRLGLDPDFSVASVRDLRKGLYSFFMPKTQVRMRYYIVEGDGPLDNLTVDIFGRIESLESALFTAEPAVDISMLCFDPDFFNPEPVLFNDRSTNASEEQIIEYDGTVETGIRFTLKPNRDVTDFTVYHTPPDGTLRQMSFAAPLIAGDTLTISTMIGDKSVIRNRSGVESSLLYALSPQSNWLELQPGSNRFRVYVEGETVPYSIEYTTKYGGL